MNKNELFLASALSISLLGAVAVPGAIFASSDVTKSRDVFNDTFDRKDPLSRFVLDHGYGHLKIFVKNRGNSTITFSLVHTDSGKQYITKTVGAGKELPWSSLDSFSQGLRSGNYEIQWRAGGDVVHVTAWGVSGTDSANTSTMVTQNAGTTTTGDRVITPQKKGNSFNFTIGGSATASGSFEVPKGFGHVKLRIRNYANAPVDFTVEHNDSGKVYVDGQTVRKNSETVWRSNDVGFSAGLRSGRYTIQFRGGSNKVNVEIWGAAGSRSSDTR
ncbi:hypothetical protein B4V02_00815 [Paenibacillus kribbensis]|uniref:Uncharacterized protein n=1 Tax=Paenibacillus kribbensis TaxID=172713 RepID=A0A222WHW9_9BACL|nr:hypothetical protein [Paenibacillus kribbensis]ASR45351.1 hypothetical protein B4V02_00815 [Paenibacillus kribbensis]